MPRPAAASLGLVAAPVTAPGCNRLGRRRRRGRQRSGRAVASRRRLAAQAAANRQSDPGRAAAPRQKMAALAAPREKMATLPAARQEMAALAAPRRQSPPWPAMRVDRKTQAPRLACRRAQRRPPALRRQRQVRLVWPKRAARAQARGFPPAARVSGRMAPARLISPGTDAGECGQPRHRPLRQRAERRLAARGGPACRPAGHDHHHKDLPRSLPRPLATTSGRAYRRPPRPASSPGATGHQRSWSVPRHRPRGLPPRPRDARYRPDVARSAGIASRWRWRARATRLRRGRGRRTGRRNRGTGRARHPVVPPPDSSPTAQTTRLRLARPSSRLLCPHRPEKAMVSQRPACVVK